MRKQIEIVKNRSDIGAGTRGSDLGIDAIEIAAINKHSYFFKDHLSVDVPTRNESVYEDVDSPFGKHIKQVYQQCKHLASIVEDVLLKNNIPLVFSGDHSSAIGTISGIRAAYPDKRLGVVWIDAHADIHSPYTTPSGNMHGMPLAALMSIDNKANAVNKVGDETLIYWDKLKKIGLESVKLAPEDLIYFGVRDTEEEEDALIERLAIRNYKVAELRAKGIEGCIQNALRQVEECDHIYISFDVDSMDSERISSGTGTPVPQGFLPEEVTEVLASILASGKVVCLEIVEVNPLLDNRGNKMAEVAFDIIEKVVPLLENHAI